MTYAMQNLLMHCILPFQNNVLLALVLLVLLVLVLLLLLSSSSCYWSSSSLANKFTAFELNALGAEYLPGLIILRLAS